MKKIRLSGNAQKAYMNGGARREKMMLRHLRAMV